jgi:hypothetical protein
MVIVMLAAAAPLQTQDVALEYQVKAAYLLNFVRFVTWPQDTRRAVTICVAVHNPFGDALKETLRNETVKQRPLVSRVILQPDPECHVVFVPQSAAVTPYLRAARDSPTLTVGETTNFIAQGGIINFVIEEGTVRFQISPEAAERAELRISSHLLRLARISGAGGR